MPRRARAPLGKPAEAALEQKELGELRTTLASAGISARVLRLLLSVLSTRRGLAGTVALFKQARDKRRRDLTEFIERECAAHSELHHLIDGLPPEDQCIPKRGASCFSPTPLVRRHFAFCQALRWVPIVPPTAKPKPKPLFVLPENARKPSDVVRVLRNAGLNMREIGLLWADYVNRDRDSGVPLGAQAIDSMHHRVRTAASVAKKR